MTKLTKYWFKYTIGLIKYKYFRTLKEAEWFAHNEGDHLLDWGRC